MPAFHALTLTLGLTGPVLLNAQALDHNIAQPRTGAFPTAASSIEKTASPGVDGIPQGPAMDAARPSAIEARDPLPGEIVHGEADAGPLPEGVIRMSSLRGALGVPEH